MVNRPAGRHLPAGRAVGCRAVLLAVLLQCAGLVPAGAQPDTATGTGQSPPPPAQPAASAQPGGDALQVRSAATFLRATPDLRGAVLARLERGTRVTVLERGPGDWWKVRVDAPPREGFVHRLTLGPVTAGGPDDRGLPAYIGPGQGAGRGVAQRPPAPAGAAPDTPVAARRGPGFLLHAGVGQFRPTARDTFDAVGLTGGLLTVGGGVEVTRLYRGLFVGARVERVKETGERVFLHEGQRFPLGIPLDVEWLPIEATVGWRLESAPGGRIPRIVPFVAGGAGVVRYRESDPFAEPEEEVDESFTSYHLAAGADVAIIRWLGVRLAYRYRAVPDAIGEAGVSAVTGETSLGGSSFSIGIVVGR